MQEIWKDIEGYEGLYQVSNLGNVKSLKRYSWNGYTFVLRNEIILKPSINQKGYYNVILSKNNNATNKRIHRLVAETFIPNPENKPQVNHIDGNKLNNCVDNLEWCTRSYNIKHAFKLGLNRKYLGSTNPNSKKLNQYDLNGNFIKQWDCIKDAMDELNICRSSIHRCCTGKFKQSNGFIWRYAD